MPITHTTHWALREPASLPAIHPQDPAVPLLALYLPAISAAFCKKHAARETPLSDSLHGWSCVLPGHNPACAAGIKPQIDLPTTTDAAPCAGANRKLLSTEPRVLLLPKGILSPKLLKLFDTLACAFISMEKTPPERQTPFLPESKYGQHS